LNRRLAQIQKSAVAAVALFDARGGGPIQLAITLGHIGDKKEGVGGGGEVFAQASLEGGPERFDGIDTNLQSIGY
jgi:hypothetical protein